MRKQLQNIFRTLQRHITSTVGATLGGKRLFHTQSQGYFSKVRVRVIAKLKKFSKFKKIFFKVRVKKIFQKKNSTKKIQERNSVKNSGKNSTAGEKMRNSAKNTDWMGLILLTPYIRDKSTSFYCDVTYGLTIVWTRTDNVLQVSKVCLN